MKDSTMKKHFLFISCEEAYHICDKSQYGESTLWEKIKLNIRYIWCRFTRAYIKQNHALTNAMKTSNVQCLQSTEREQLIDKFNQELKNQM